LELVRNRNESTNDYFNCPLVTAFSLFEFRLYEKHVQSIGLISKREEVTGGCKKSDNQELNNCTVHQYY